MFSENMSIYSDEHYNNSKLNQKHLEKCQNINKRRGMFIPDSRVKKWHNVFATLIAT